MAESATHLLQTAPGVRLWLAPEVAEAENAAEWLQRGEQLLEQRAAEANAVIGGGRHQTRRVLLGDQAGHVDPNASGWHGVWRINRHGGLLGSVQGDRYRTPTRLQAEIELSEALRSRGIATPRVLLALAVKHGLSWRQHLITEEVAGAVTVFDARKDQEALTAADQLLQRLCDVGLWATDLHPGNMLWQAAELTAETANSAHPTATGRGASRCWVIDLAGAKLLPNPLNPEQRLARRRRFARFFAKHGGEVPPLFADASAGK